MPVQKVKKDCYKYGESGKVYCGKDGKEKAERQGRAIKASQQRRKEKLK